MHITNTAARAYSPETGKCYDLTKSTLFYTPDRAERARLEKMEKLEAAAKLKRQRAQLGCLDPQDLQPPDGWVEGERTDLVIGKKVMVRLEPNMPWVEV